MLDTNKNGTNITQTPTNCIFDTPTFPH